jgi:hypothetical protein
LCWCCGALPPKAKAAVCVPAPAKPALAVFKPVGLFVQEVPSYSSVAFVGGCSIHQKLKLLFEFLYLLNNPFLLYLNYHLPKHLAVVASSTFQTLEVELYQTCPSIGLLGSAERF